MKRLLIVILMLIAIQDVVQSKDNNPFNTKEWWSRLVYEDELSIDNTASIDTSIVVVTNRSKLDDKLRFMSEETGDGKLIYLYVYAHNSQWHVLETEDLEEALSYIPDINRNWVVYTEGMGKIFPSELNRGMRMTSQYKVNVLMLDYPSITTTKGSLGNYYFAISHARSCYKDHQPVLVNIKELKETGKLGTGRLSLFFHSMGNYLLKEIIEHDMLTPLNNSKWVDNVILNSACVDADDHSDWLRYVFFAERIYIHYNTQDMVLKGASIAAFERQLGKGPGYPLVANATYFNFNNVVGRGHSYFVDLKGRKPVAPDVKTHYSEVLNGGQPNLNNPYLYRQSKHSHVCYDVIHLMP